VEHQGYFNIDDDIWANQINESIVLLLGFFTFFVTLIFIALALFLLYLFIKRLFLTYDTKPKKEDALEIRTALNIAKTKPKEKTNNKIRIIYQKFLNQCSKRDIKITNFMTSQDIEDIAKKTFNTPHTNRLRDIYIKVRYGGAEPSKDDINMAKEAYASILKSEGQK